MLTIEDIEKVVSISFKVPVANLHIKRNTNGIHVSDETTSHPRLFVIHIASTIFITNVNPCNYYKTHRTTKYHASNLVESYRTTKTGRLQYDYIIEELYKVLEKKAYSLTSPYKFNTTIVLEMQRSSRIKLR